jgi:hypothetical protein
MKRILLIGAAVVGVVLFARAEMLRVTTSITTSTNANVTAQADVYGVLRRAVITVSGGTSTVSVADSDGTAILSTNNLTGSYTWTGTAYIARAVVTTTNSAWAATNAAATVSILWTVEQ